MAPGLGKPAVSSCLDDTGLVSHRDYVGFYSLVKMQLLHELNMESMASYMQYTPTRGVIR